MYGLLVGNIETFISEFRALAEGDVLRHGEVGEVGCVELHLVELAPHLVQHLAVQLGGRAGLLQLQPVVGLVEHAELGILHYLLQEGVQLVVLVLNEILLLVLLLLCLWGFR